MKKKKQKKADFLRDKNKSSLATAPKHHKSDSHGVEEVDSAGEEERALSNPYTGLHSCLVSSLYASLDKDEFDVMFRPCLLEAAVHTRRARPVVSTYVRFSRW